MKFDWQESEKERFFKRAERQLEKAGIDFVGVDRTKFGVRGWNEQEGTVEAVVVTLTSYPYQHFSNIRKSKLMKLGNWECTDNYRKGFDRPMFMHSRLIIKETRGRKRKNESEIRNEK